MKNIDIKITTGILKRAIQKKFISVVAEKILRLIARRARYIIAGMKNKYRIMIRLVFKTQSFESRQEYITESLFL
jgi:hypothetical protein